VETIGSKRSYALTWCMPNNDDDDDDDDDDIRSDDDDDDIRSDNDDDDAGTVDIMLCCWCDQNTVSCCMTLSVI